MVEKKYDVSIPMEEVPEKRRPVLKECLAPVLFLLRLFGLYYEDTCKKKGWTNFFNKASKLYSAVVLLASVAAVGKSIAALFYQEDTDDYYTVSAFIIYYTKCAVQVYACVRMSHRPKERMLWSFIERMEQFLTTVKLCECRKIEKALKRKLKRWLIVLVGIYLGCMSINIFVVVHPLDGFAELIEKSLSPFPNTTSVLVGRSIFEAFILAFWFLPIALCGVLTQSMAFAFDEYFRYLKYRKKLSGLCLRTYIREIREKYVAMTTMCEDLDKMMSLIFMVSYLTDIILVCLLLRVSVHGVSDTVSRLLVLSWTFPSLFSLVTLSFFSAQLVDKGETMLAYIQKIDISDVTLDAKVQLDLMLFHLTAQPVVLTIWKMVPLYKSIIISIFVSIITYFTIMLAY